MDKILLQALSAARGLGERSIEELFEQCWPYYSSPGRLTAAEAIGHLDPAFPPEQATCLFLIFANLEMLRYFVEFQGMRQAQYDEMREHLLTLAQAYVGLHAQQVPVQEQNETYGLPSEQACPSQVDRPENGGQAHDVGDLENRNGNGDRAFLEALIGKGVEMLQEQAVSCAAAYQAGATAEDATRHLSLSPTREVVRRFLLDLMNLQRVELLIIPGGITQAQFEELCEHLSGLEEAYARYLASEAGYPLGKISRKTPPGHLHDQ